MQYTAAALTLSMGDLGAIYIANRSSFIGSEALYAFAERSQRFDLVCIVS